MNDVQATTHGEIDERFKEMSDSEIVETTEGLLRSALKIKEDIFIPSLNCSVRKRTIELAKQMGSVYKIHNKQRLESRRITEDNQEQKRKNELEKLQREQNAILNES
jgi:superfamily II DNA/RNA helicase